MIDNVILLITGTLHERDTHELLERCHPLGTFDTMAALCVATNVEELFNSVLVETPLAPYFRDCLSSSDLDELNIEVIRNTLYKVRSFARCSSNAWIEVEAQAYLEDFHAHCQTLNGPTAEQMDNLLSFEGDRRTINIAVNSLGTALSKDERAKLLPALGRLYPEGHLALSRADDIEQIKSSVELVSEYREFFSAPNGSDNAQEGAENVENACFKREVELNRLAFLQQFSFATFYAYFKLKEQEVRNMCVHRLRFRIADVGDDVAHSVWASECIQQNAVRLDPLALCFVPDEGLAHRRTAWTMACASAVAI